jgi:hypothetical protein
MKELGDHDLSLLAHDLRGETELRSQKRWAWSLYPLKPDAWESREIGDTATPPGQTVEVRQSVGRGRITYLSTGESGPMGTRTLKQKFYLPSEADVLLLANLYPDDNPFRPPWARIEAELVAAGQDPDRLRKMNAPAVLSLLEKARTGARLAPEAQPPATKKPPGRPTKSGDTDPAADRKTHDAFKASGQTYADFARSDRKVEREVRLAVDRHRKRLGGRKRPREDPR